MSEGPDLLIRGAAQLLTMDGSGEDEEGLGIIEDAALAASGGKVLWVGRTGELPKEHSSPSRTVEATSRVVMPGLIDPHTHLIFAGTREEEFRERALGRSYREIAARGGGIKATVRATREAPLEELVRLGLERLDRMLEFGVTTVEVKSGYGLSPEAELKSLEAISELNRLHPLEVVPTFMGAH
ncbi:MAG: imidazolonepropionase, partial [Nitrospinota bacterium]